MHPAHAGFFYGKYMESIKASAVTEGRRYLSAEQLLSNVQAPFELLGIRIEEGMLRTVLTVPTQGLDAMIRVGETPHVPGVEYDLAVLEATKDATDPKKFAGVSISGTIIDFTTRNRTVFLDKPDGTTWIATGETFEHAITNGFAAMVSEIGSLSVM